MLKTTLSILMLIVSVSIAFAKDPDDTKAIREAALSYMEGWYKGDVKKKTTVNEVIQEISSILPG